MTSPESPPGCVVRMEAQKATADNGFRLEHGAQGGWLRYSSTTAQGEVWIGGVSLCGSRFLSTNHPGVAAELGAPAPSSTPASAASTPPFSALTGSASVDGIAHRAGDGGAT
jgi:hypothetical protein